MKRRPEPRLAKPSATTAVAHERSSPFAATNGRKEQLTDVLLAGTVALLVATPLIPSEATTEGIQTPINVLWLLLLLAWCLGLLLRGRQPLRFGWTEVAFAALAVWNVVSGLATNGQNNGRQMLCVVWQWVTYAVIVFLLRQLVRTPEQSRGATAVMIAVGLLLSSHAYYQYGYSLPRMRAEFARNPERMLAENGMPTDASSPIRRLFEARVNSTEPLATFALTNSLAGYLAPWLVVTLGIALTSFGRRSWPQIIGCGCIAAALAGALFLTKSRTAVLATMIGLGLLAVYGRRSGWQFGWKLPIGIAAIGGVLVLAAVFVGALDVQVLSEAPLSVRYRLEFWQATAAMIADHPLLGVGPGNFQQHYAQYKLPQASEMIMDPHNFVLEIWATAGTPALLLLGCVAAAIVYELSRRITPADAELPENDRPLMGTTAPAETRQSSAREKVWWVYGGAVIGLLLAYPLGLLVGYPPDMAEIRLPVMGLISLPVIWLIGLPVGVAGIALLHGWVLRGELPAVVLVIGLLTLTINLLAAGAASFPGVVNVALVCLALALPRRAPPERTRWPALGVSIGAAAFCLALLGAYIFTQYRPVLNERVYQLQSQADRDAGRFGPAQAALERAAAADPWSPEPWRLLAELRLQRCRADSSPRDWQRFADAERRAVALNPHSATQFDRAAQWRLLAAARVDRDANLQQAIEYLQHSVQLYPNGAYQHAKLAWALHRAGRDAEAAAPAAEAMRLDALHNHREHKLTELHLFDPLGQGMPESKLRPESAAESLAGLLPAP